MPKPLPEPPPGPNPAPARALDPRLRALLVCPACRGELSDAPAGLGCAPCGLVYPIVDGVPCMVPEEALRP